MFRLILFITMIPIGIALAARWWFGTRVLVGDGARACRSDLARWLPPPGDKELIHRAEGTALEFGRQLRDKAMAEWKEQDPKAVDTREKSRRFGLAVPPLSAVVAVMAAIVGRVPVWGGISIVLAATATACLFGLLALPSELAAIARAARRMREDRAFPNSEDEEAVVRCANAHAWNAALPPIVRWITG